MIAAILLLVGSRGISAADDLSAVAPAKADFPKPYSPPCVERENVFEFTEKPKVKNLGNDKYEITFAAKGNCDVTVGIVDEKGTVVRHLGSGVLGANAPAPFQRNSLRQTIYWNGKDDLDVYHKTPEKLKVRVMLGLKPEFDKRLGGASPHNLPGYVWGLVVAEDGAYVFSKHVSNVRKFDRDGRYLRSVIPPPANMPDEKLNGMSFVEYEAGKHSLHGPDIHGSISEAPQFLPYVAGNTSAADCQMALAGGRIFYANSGYMSNAQLLYFFADGSTDAKGLKGRPFVSGTHFLPRLAASPDGRWIYSVVDGLSCVFRCAADGTEKSEVFIGEPSNVGSDDRHFNKPGALDCDAAGRIYVADEYNSRVQVFSPEGKFLKTIPVDRPYLVRVHQKSGGIYVFHVARVEGQSTGRLTKCVSFDDPREEYHVDGQSAAVCAVDSWSAKPRLWTAGHRTGVSMGAVAIGQGGGSSVRIWEEDGGRLRLLLDFDEQARKEEGENYLGRFSGWVVGVRLSADPVREQVVFNKSLIFDLRTGRPSGKLGLPGSIDDLAFDKRGYLHCHFNPGFYQPGVGRLDPEQATRRDGRPAPTLTYKEVPYDYGEEAPKIGWLGILPVKDQPGAKFFQDGIGVNMRGDVSEVCNIYYAPKMDELVASFLVMGGNENTNIKESMRNPMNAFIGEQNSSYADMLRKFQDAEKRGEAVYSIRRQPGIGLAGGTIWTYERHGELRQECAVLEGKLINGVQMDEDGAVYFVTSRTKMFGGRQFLEGRGGTLGAPGEQVNLYPFTGTLVKTRKDGRSRILSASAPIPLEPLPDRPPDLMSVSFSDPAYFNKGHWCWVEGAEWIYAGASPIVSTGCSCPTQRFHTDWYKRTFVPEAYRHSIGVLDTNGNLIMHLGRYGNFDSASGPNSQVPVGGDGIGMIFPGHVSGTDNYLVFADCGDRLVALKLNYQAEETVGIGGQ